MGHLKRLGRVTLDRLVELMREIGVLVMAFTPLDAILAKDKALNPLLIRIFVLGGILFVLALLGEWLVGFLKKEEKADGG